MHQISVILADSSPVVLSGFRNIVEKNPRMQVVEEAISLRSLEEALARNPGCVSIVEWHMATLEAASQLTKNTNLILSAMPDSVATRHHALRLGVRGFLGTHQSPADIRKAVLTVASGQIWVGDTTAEALLSHHLSADRAVANEGDGVGRLTPREKQVIQMACQGLKSRAIATELRISEPTVAHHFTSIYSKLGVDDRVGLIIFAYQHALHPPTMPALAPQSPLLQAPLLQAPVSARLQELQIPGRPR